MNCGHSLLKAFSTVGLILLLGASMNANAGLFGLGGSSWKEEVQLHDGQKIIVERSQTYGGRTEPGQSSPIKEHTIRFTLPGSGQTITWTSEYGEDLGRTNFNLLALHVLNGTPHIVTEPNLCLSYNKWGRPNPPYVFFKYDGNAWQRISLEQFPAEFKTINVAHNTLGRDAQDLVRVGLVSAEKVREMNVSSAPEYKSILREPLERAGRNCGEMVSNGKGRWVGMGWFRKQPSYDACVNYCFIENFSAQYCPCATLFKGK